MCPCPTSRRFFPRRSRLPRCVRSPLGSASRS
jgi:hypothetical protein